MLVAPATHAQDGAEPPTGDGPAFRIAQEGGPPADEAADAPAESPAEPAADATKTESASTNATSPSSSSVSESTATLIERWPYFSTVELPAFDKARWSATFW